MVAVRATIRERNAAFPSLRLVLADQCTILQGCSRPRVSGSVNIPMLKDLASTRIGMHCAGVGKSSRNAPAMHILLHAHRCQRLRAVQDTDEAQNIVVQHLTGSLRRFEVLAAVVPHSEVQVFSGRGLLTASE